MGDTSLAPQWLLRSMPSLPRAASGSRPDEIGRLPLMDALRIASSKLAPGDPHGVLFACTIAALSSWETTQGVYEFDREFAECLSGSAGAQELRSDLLLRLPEPCVWVQSPVAIADGAMGFFAGTTDTGGLLLLPVPRNESQDGWSIRGVILMTLDREVDECLREVDKCFSGDGDPVAALRRSVRTMVSMLFYLCTEEPDIITTNESRLNRQRLRQSKTPFHPTIHHVGFRYGAAFRKAKEERAASEGAGGTGKSPTPHIRRAHWHTFWKGARGTEERHQVVKWLPPIPVNLKSYDDLVPTIRKVKR